MPVPGGTAGGGSGPPATAPADRLLMIQYTSGSTSEPKGVMIGDKCMAHNNLFVRRYGSDGLRRTVRLRGERS